MASPIRVLIADDQAVVRHGLKLFLDLQDDIEVVGEAEDGLEAAEKTKALSPQVVLMDLVMPRVDGIAGLRSIRASSPDTKVLVLTSFADDEKVVGALRAGAAGFLMKDVEPEQLVEAIRTVERGDPLLHPDIARRLMSQFAVSRTGPEGTVTILFTDIQDSSGIVQRLGDEASRALFRKHDALLRTALGEHSGVEVKHQGDGLMVAFSSARKATLCAIEMSRVIDRHNQEHAIEPLRVRIGLHTGEVIAEEEDYFGETVIVASRIMGQARGGQILVSEITKALVRAATCCFVDRGERPLKGIPGPHRLFEVEWEANGE